MSTTDVKPELTSKCNLFSSGAPLLASRFKLQYRHTRCTNAGLFRIRTLSIYISMRSTIIAGTSGGPRRYVLAYARAALDEDEGRWTVPSANTSVSVAGDGVEQASRTSRSSFY